MRSIKGEGKKGNSKQDDERRAGEG